MLVNHQSSIAFCREKQKFVWKKLKKNLKFVKKETIFNVYDNQFP